MEPENIDVKDLYIKLKEKTTYHLSIYLEGYPPKLGKFKNEYEDSILEFELRYNFINDAKVTTITQKYKQDGGKTTTL